MFEKIAEKVQIAASKKILFLTHAINQMNRVDRMITTSEVRCVVGSGEIIEDYPEDARGHSCLISGYGEYQRTIHVVCSPKEDYLAIITTYLPDQKKWSNDFKKRKTV